MEGKWIAVVGSPRIGKNTDLLVNYIIEALNSKNIYVEKYILNSKNITTCNGCESCMDIGECIIKDDMSGIINAMKTADGCLFASPSYNYNVTAQMKALLDRTFSLNDYQNGWKSRIAPGKKAIIAGVCKGKTKESMGYTTECMKNALSELGIKIIETIEYYNTKNLPVMENKEIQIKIAELINSNKEL